LGLPVSRKYIQERVETVKKRISKEEEINSAINVI
jgi:hypothetical protein